MKTAYYKFCEEVGEVDAFFDLTDGYLTLITCWSCNDGNWRSEYMSGLLKYFDGEVKTLPEQYDAEAEKLVNAYFGWSGVYEDDDDDDVDYEYVDDGVAIEEDED